jgi:multicomponent Na+:H+ antiporter subunit B
MMKRLIVILVLVGMAAAFFPVAGVIQERQDLSSLASEYLKDSPSELKAANTVTAVVVTYRGLDTLGEVTVLFAAAAGVGLIFAHNSKKKKDDKNPPKDNKEAEGSELLSTGAGILIPAIFLFGAYIFLHGHLTPGGGFQGGVVIATGVLFAYFAGALGRLNHGFITVLEGLSGFSYVAVGILGLWLAGGFLDPSFLPTGSIGELFSAGAIPVIYSLIGIKVGAEMSGVIDSMKSYS